MPIKLYRRGDTKAIVIRKTCDVCNAPDPCFGFGVYFLEALKQLEKGNRDRANELLGKWYCFNCIPEKSPEKPPIKKYQPAQGQLL